MEITHYQHITTNQRIVIPQIRTYTRYETRSVVMFDCAESPSELVFTGDSVQTGSQSSYLRLFALSYGMTMGE